MRTAISRANKERQIVTVLKLIIAKGGRKSHRAAQNGQNSGEILITN